ncbi:unnamed protein product [Rangifer tarandus platyrhynchus]|uniref:Uncharacterized protein n=1 Tax=Rangifer tarandus platyrhynchus TaxID=3082113 RepID=A0ABN8ZY49_RANTA|nr:unnamed protein product [Rangifer tarandus platyrhynchus]
MNSTDCLPSGLDQSTLEKAGATTRLGRRELRPEERLCHGRLGAGPAWGPPLTAASPAAVSSALLGRPRVSRAAPRRPGFLPPPPPETPETCQQDGFRQAPAAGDTAPLRSGGWAQFSAFPGPRAPPGRLPACPRQTLQRPPTPSLKHREHRGDEAALARGAPQAGGAGRVLAEGRGLSARPRQEGAHACPARSRTPREPGPTGGPACGSERKHAPRRTEGIFAVWPGLDRHLGDHSHSP